MLVEGDAFSECTHTSLSAHIWCQYGWLEGNGEQSVWIALVGCGATNCKGDDRWGEQSESKSLVVRVWPGDGICIPRSSLAKVGAMIMLW
jgi:hypothetical protein